MLHAFVTHLLVELEGIWETIIMTFGVLCVYVCVSAAYHQLIMINNGRILMKLRMDIPVHHAQCV